ncbi:unnamed protein product [Dimorphilus gyrociliatus]|uniref:N-acetyltransferase domain-containing protein n=1 Tax=Dimorphilus gyrociliatus TaxID=2664684 RepID=A0A7I8W696_9ANNE|nr:unnamed protein product [Dimorphilus gyrociliatus]
MFHEMKEFEKLEDDITTTPEILNRDCFGPNKFFSAIVAENEKKEIAGYSIYFKAYSTFQGRMLYMEDIYVVPNYRHLGVGKKLLKKVASIAVSEDCCRIHFAALEWNKNATNWYKKVGGIDLTDFEEWHLFRIGREALEKYSE